MNKKELKKATVIATAVGYINGVLSGILLDSNLTPLQKEAVEKSKWHLEKIREFLYDDLPKEK